MDGLISIKMIVMKGIENPFRVTVKHWDQKISVELDRSDITFDEYIELLRTVSKAIGWGEDDIKEYFGE